MEVMNFFEPNDTIFSTYNACSDMIKQVLPDAEVSLIGSWAVPLLGRNEIDCMIIVDNVISTQKILEKASFSSGPIINGEGFSKNRTFGEIICEAHILPNGHPKIGYYRWMIEQLKRNKALRDSYADMKRSMQGQPIEKYREAKRVFLYEVTSLGWQGKERNY